MGHVYTTERQELKERHAATAHFIRTIQTAVYEWHQAERQETDTLGWNFDATAIGNLVNYFPRDSLTRDALVYTLHDTDGVSSDDTALFTGVAHGGGDSFSLRWYNPFITGTGVVTDAPTIELRLIGVWDDDHWDYLRGLIPAILKELRHPGSVGVAGETLRVSIPHPAAQGVLSAAMRRGMTEDQGGLVSPVLFHTLQFKGSDLTTTPPTPPPLAGQPCTRTTTTTPSSEGGAIALDPATGDVYACVEAPTAAPGTPSRRWLKINATNIYCRDTRLGPGDGGYFENAPNQMPIVRHAWLNTIDDVRDPLTKSRVPATEIKAGGSSLWRCPVGGGYTSFPKNTGPVACSSDPTQCVGFSVKGTPPTIRMCTVLKCPTTVHVNRAAFDGTPAGDGACCPADKPTYNTAANACV